MLRRFRLEEPESVQEASELLARHGEAARIYAGGTELLLVMKEGLAHYERLVNVKKIPHLDRVNLDDGLVSIGGLSTHRQLSLSPVVRQQLPVFADMEANVANIRVREVGTIGGNLCFAEPHADPGTVLLVLGARLIAAKGTGQREIPIESFFADAYETCLEPDELLTEIRIPVLPARSGVAYLKFGYLERPSVGVALFLSLDGNGKSVGEARIAVGCVGPKPKRIQEAESLLGGKSIVEASRLIPDAGAAAARASQAISDLHGSQDYKEHIVGVLLKRAFQKAIERCR
jgi:carbon-monoxide dehydrogenase medium subunit